MKNMMEPRSQSTTPNTQDKLFIVNDDDDDDDDDDDKEYKPPVSSYTESECSDPSDFSLSQI